MQYRNGIIISTGAAVTLELGFVPDKFQVTNYGVLGDATAANVDGVGYSTWIRNVTPSANALITTYTNGAGIDTLLTSNGFTPVDTGGDWTNTVYAIATPGITKANPGVVTLAAVTNLAEGDTVTINNVLGMTQVNTNRYVVTNLNVGAKTFELYDTFGDPVDTSGYTTYTASPISGTVNVISTTATPPGLQFDEGFAGIILGTGVVGTSTDVLFWEAFFATPTGW